MTEQERVVRDFVEAWNQMSFDGVISHLGDDIYFLRKFFIVPQEWVSPKYSMGSCPPGSDAPGYTFATTCTTIFIALFSHFMPTMSPCSMLSGCY